MEGGEEEWQMIAYLKPFLTISIVVLPSSFPCCATRLYCQQACYYSLTAHSSLSRIGMCPSPASRRAASLNDLGITRGCAQRHTCRHHRFLNFFMPSIFS